MLCQIYLLQNFAFIFAPSVRPVDLDKLKSWGSVSSSAAQGNLTHSVYESHSYCCSLVTESCPTLCDPMDCSTPSSPVLHYLPEFAQLHTHWFSDAICVWLATRWSPMALTFSYPHLCAFPLFSVLAAVTDLLLMNGKLAMMEYHFHAWVISRTWTFNIYSFGYYFSGSPSHLFRIISLWEKSATMERQPCGQGTGGYQQLCMQSWSWVLRVEPWDAAGPANTWLWPPERSYVINHVDNTLRDFCPTEMYRK